MDQPTFTPRDGQDHRLDCWFCGEPSIAVAPRHTGGDIDLPCHFIPVCVEHAAGWYDDVPSGDELPMIPREGVFLPTVHAEALYAALRHDDDGDRLYVNREVDNLFDALDSISAGLRHLRLF